MRRFLALLRKQFIRGGFFHPTKNHSVYIEQFRRLKGKKIINIGAGGYDPIPGAVNVDPYREGPNTIKAFGENLPFKNASFDLAVCVAVLEHVKEPERIVKEMHRVLKPGGRIYIEMPFIQPYHAAPDDYQRLTMPGLEYLLRDFKKIDAGIAGGPGSGIAWLIVEYLQLFSGSKKIKKILKNIAKVAVSPLKYIDNWLNKKQDSIITAGGFYYYGEK